MNRAELTIGQKVKVVPAWTNTDLPAPPEKEMYVRELHNKKTAGLSFRKTGKHVYGILYEVIQPC